MPNKETKKTALVPRRQKGPIVYIFVSIVAAIAILVAAVLLVNRVIRTDYKHAKIGDATYMLEVADTQDKQQNGLSGRDGLSANTGMLFDFKRDGDWRMWMLQMRFAIDIAWLNSDGKIIYIKHSAQPAEFPEKYYADRPSRFVIEVAAGTFKQHGIAAGDTVSIW